MRLFSFVASLCLLTFPSLARGAEQPWTGEPFSLDPKAALVAAQAAPAGEADLIVLLDEVRYTFDESGRATTSERLVFRVVDESAVEDWSTVETSWSPWYQERPVFAARVIGVDGTVHTLDPKVVVESAADDVAEIFSDRRVLRAPLPGMGKGAVVEQVISWRDANPLFDTGTAGSMSFGRWVPVERTRLVIEAPATLRMKFVDRTSPTITPSTTEKDGRRRIVYESGRTEPFEDLEWNLPYDQSSVPYVAFSTGTSWQEAARRYSEIVERQIGDATAVQAFLRSAVGKSTGRREIVAKALAAIQKNVRYAGVEVGEGSIIPRPPKDVVTLKYGDCKDKATLLVAMLRVAGIPAHVALLKAGTGLDIDADLPSLDRFDHVIVRVEGDDPFWVDPTDEFSPAGVLPISDQDRFALIADSTTAALVKTPASDARANVVRETRTFILAEEGTSTVTEVTEGTGAHDSSSRGYAASEDRKDYRESMESYAKQAYLAESLKDMKVTDPRDLTTPFRVTLEIEKATRGVTGDIDAVVFVFPSALTASLPWSLRSKPEEEEDVAKRPKARTRDFVITMPYVKEFEYRIVPPAGFTARTLPANERRQLGSASLATKYEVAADGVVHATLRFDSGKRRLTPVEMEAMRDAVVELTESNAVLIGFDSIGWGKLNAGDIRGAIAEFRRLAALHPREARHHVQIGRAYFVGGMAEIAREELRRAIALEPSYAPAHRFLGVVLQHDLLAREFRKGCDLPAAIAAYRKACELAPKDLEIRSELATLLTRGDDGALYSKGAHLAEAIEEYKSIASDLKDDRFEGDLLTAMAYAGRFDEMKERARTVKDDKKRIGALVIAAAATSGPEAALREASSVDNTVRREVLIAAYPALLSLRLYPEAAAVLEQASLGSPNASQVRPIIEVVRRAKRFENLQLGEDPKSFVKRLTVLSVTVEDEDAATKEFVASWARSFEESIAKARRPEDVKPKRSQGKAKSAAQGLPVGAAIEIGIAAMDITEEGSDAIGYRVRMRSKIPLPGAAAAPAQTFYLARESGRYVLGAIGPAEAAVTVLHFADGGELEAARTWLNWVRDDVGAGAADDPLSGSAFAAIWPKSKQSATADEIRTAAAVLLASKQEYASAAIPHLLAVRAAAPDAVRTHVDFALGMAYVEAEKTDESVAIFRRVAEAVPDSETGFAMYAAVLSDSGQLDEVRRIANARLEKSQNDVYALRALSRVAAHTGDFKTADAYIRRLTERADAEATDYNQLAWDALFIGGELQEAIQNANQALALYRGSAVLHTLAALYAETENSLEARAKLLESMDAAGNEEPSGSDWYVLGRIAENYGANDAALAAYKRVTPPKRERFGTTFQLAQERVKRLKSK